MGDFHQSLELHTHVLSHSLGLRKARSKDNCKKTDMKYKSILNAEPSQEQRNTQEILYNHSIAISGALTFYTQRGGGGPRGTLPHWIRQ